MSQTSVKIKRGDATKILLGTGAMDLSDYESAVAFLRNEETDEVITVNLGDGPFDSQGIVELELTSDDTSVGGSYLLELQFEPGPHTYPSNGYFRVFVGEDLG